MLFDRTDNYYVINPQKETLTNALFKAVDANFEVEIEAKTKGRIIKFKGKESTVFHFNLQNFKTSVKQI